MEFQPKGQQKGFVSKKLVVRAAVPAFVAVASIGSAFIYPEIVSASVPSLAPMSAQKLIAMAMHPTKPIFLGTVTETGNLGIPSTLVDSIPSSPNPLIGLATQALTGTSSYSFWRTTNGQFRIAIPSPKGETDFFVGGGVAWSWNSTDNSATKYLVKLPAHGSTKTSNVRAQVKTPLTPSEVSSKFLSHLPSGSTVSVITSQYVAGIPAYTLVINANNSSSLLKSVSIAIDATTGQTLGVSLNSTQSSSPAFSIDYQSLSYSMPSESTVTFVPPTGVAIKTVTKSLTMPSNTNSSTQSLKGSLTSEKSTLATDFTTVGSGFSKVVIYTPHTLASSKMATGRYASMLKAAGTPVTTSFGSGTIVSTYMASVFIGNNGTMAVGAVPYSVLLADLK